MHPAVGSKLVDLPKPSGMKCRATEWKKNRLNGKQNNVSVVDWSVSYVLLAASSDFDRPAEYTAHHLT